MSWDREGSTVLKMLRRDGWVLARMRGSHRQYHHPSKRGTVTLAGKLSDELDRGTLKSILKTGWSRQMSRYLIVIEQTRTGFSAYSPDLPGCVATGATRNEVEQNMREAIAFHLEGLRLEGEIPAPGTSYSFVEI